MTQYIINNKNHYIDSSSALAWLKISDELLFKSENYCKWKVNIITKSILLSKNKSINIIDLWGCYVLNIFVILRFLVNQWYKINYFVLNINQSSILITQKKIHKSFWTSVNFHGIQTDLELETFEFLESFTENHLNLFLLFWWIFSELSNSFDIINCIKKNTKNRFEIFIEDDFWFSDNEINEMVQYYYLDKVKKFFMSIFKVWIQDDYMKYKVDFNNNCLVVQVLITNNYYDQMLDVNLYKGDIIILFKKKYITCKELLSLYKNFKITFDSWLMIMWHYE